MRTSNQPVRQRRMMLNTKKRGTIIVLAVGILAVLSVAALSYMTVVKLDRSSSQAYATITNFRQQVDVTTSHIGSLLTADLFGNKIVTSSTPRVDQSNQRIWPKMFEDGEYWDYPSVDTSWLMTPTDPNEQLYNDLADPSRRVRDELAPTDDAWLASQQPIDTDMDNFWDTWPQIANIRSGFFWQVDQSQAPGGFWRRDHGRYVNLSEWITRSQGNPALLQRGDPGLDISNFDTGLAGYSGSYSESNGDGTSPPPLGSGPNLGVDSDYLGAGPNIGTNLRVFDMQMSRMHEFFNGDTSDVDDIMLPAASGSTVNQVDSMLWADTDGDGRADARWQQLDSHGELFGYKWVVAARIIDSSAKISANSSFEWQFPGDSDDVGYGRTPADIDLYRLLRRATLHPDVAVNSSLSLEDHYDFYRSAEAWNLEAAFDEINDHFSGSFGWVDLPHDGSGGGPTQLTAMTPLDRREREMLWQTMGAAPRLRTTTKAVPMPIGDEIDLRTSEGSNQSLLVSKLEQRLDQVPGSGGIPIGYLPGMESPGGSLVEYPDADSLGPMRAVENEREVLQYDSDDARTPQNPGGNTYPQTAKLERLQTDIRRHMTMVNGVGDFSPVPVVNTAFEYNEQFFNRKIRINDPGVVRAPVADPEDLDEQGITAQIQDFIQRAFGAFMWSLAPLATDTVTAAGLLPADVGEGANEQQYHYGGSNTAMDSPASSLTPDPEASYATLRALSLAINLADALDHDENSEEENATRESPTLTRFFPTTDLDSIVVDIREALITPTFSHGTVPDDSFEVSQTGGTVGGVVLVGLDRQPFLKQAYYTELYQDFDSSSSADGNLFGDLFDPNAPTAEDQVGSMFVVELGNPWPEPIDVQDYVIRISYGDAIDQFVAPIDVINGGSSVIPAGGSKSFFMLFETGREGIFDLAWDAFLTEVFNQFDAKGLIRDDNLVELNQSNPDTVIPLSGGPIPFNSFAGLSLPVQLIYRYPGRNHDVLVDRLSPPSGTFPVPDQMVTLAPFPSPAPSGILNADITGSARFARSNNLHRPMGQTSGTGFPSYVIERRSENEVNPRVETHSWRESASMPIDDQDEILDPPLIGLHPGLFVAPTPGDETGSLLNLDSFQLFVPNGPLRSVSELHLLNVFTHRYRIGGSAYVGTPVNSPVYSLLNAHESPDPAIANSNTDAGDWLTISEQLGQNIHYNYKSSAGNPYLGVLDPTRYVLGEDLGDPTPNTPGAAVPNFLPDSLRIPLANRVFDCFTVLPTSRKLVQGKINLNTAPLEVLESMPFFEPESDVDGSLIGTLPAATGASRADLVKSYRDMDAPFSGMGDRAGQMMGGLRTLIDPVTNNNRRGLVNVGELLAMSDWTMSADGNPSALPGFEDFMQLALDGSGNDGAPLSLRYATGADTGVVSSDFNELGNHAGRVDYPVPTFDPVDDPEERLALARSALDIAAVRSDVFTAWFIIRGYDPEQIESIQAPDALGETLRSQLMNPGGATMSPGLDPVYETRWLVVFDRSQIRRPNERPRVLLQVELPVN